MTDKELRRLSRRELLQLLLAQGRETEGLRQLSEEKEGQLEELNRNYERLKKRLDQKDEQIRQLKATLEEERTNRRIELEEAGSIAEAALRLNGVFDTAQKAAEHYLYNIRLLYDRKMAEAGKTEEPPVPLPAAAERPGKRPQKGAPGPIQSPQEAPKSHGIPRKGPGPAGAPREAWEFPEKAGKARDLPEEPAEAFAPPEGQEPSGLPGRDSEERAFPLPTGEVKEPWEPSGRDSEPEAFPLPTEKAKEPEELPGRDSEPEA